MPEEAKSGGERRQKVKTKTKDKAPKQGEQEENPQYRDHLRMKMLKKVPIRNPDQGLRHAGPSYF